MARSTLFARLRHHAHLALRAHAEGVLGEAPLGSAQWRGSLPKTPREGAVTELAARDRMHRRDVLRGAGVLAATPLLGALSACGDDGGNPANARVAVLGAGLAGLHAAYRLAQLGVPVDVYEASDRAGGRTFTARGMLDAGQIAELGGELIDSGHLTMQALAEELGLTLDDLQEPEGVRAETFYIGGRIVPEEEILTAWEPVAPLLAAAFEAAETDDDEYARLDAISLRDWLAENVADETLRTLLDVAYVGEYGRETNEQSVLNMVYLIGFDDTEHFKVFGVSDERYHIHEGSSAIAEALAAELGDRVRLRHRVTAIREGAAVRVVAESPSGTVEEDYDHVIVTLPFTILRDVAIEVPISADKRAIVDALGYGTNAKLMMQTTYKPWRNPPEPVGATVAGGAGFADNGAQTFWETSRGQAGEEGILTHFLGGTAGAAANEGTPESLAERVLPLLDEIFPGTEDAYNGNVLRMHWPSVPTALGSYACYAPGQWAYYGVEGEREGRLHFCGEHTSLDFQGYMEGAAETGLRAAMDVANALDLGRITAPLSSAVASLPRSRRLAAFAERARSLRAKRALAGG